MGNFFKFILIISIFLCNFSFGYGLSCWEEYTAGNDTTPPSTSAIRTALDSADVEYVLVSTRLSIHKDAYETTFPLIAFDHLYNGTTYLKVAYSSSTINSLSSASYSYTMSGGVSGTIVYNIHTFCTVPKNGEGSEGGASTAAVNYIIKAD